MRIAVVQTDPVFGRKDENIAAAIGLMDSGDADLYVLPELFATGYHFADAAETASLAEPVEGRTFLELAAFARRRRCHVYFGRASCSVRV